MIRWSRCSANGRSPRTASATSRFRSTGANRAANIPASIRDCTSRSSAIAMVWSAWSEIVVRNRRCRSLTSPGVPCNNRSAATFTIANGVRTSWLTAATRSARAAAVRRASASSAPNPAARRSAARTANTATPAGSTTATTAHNDPTDQASTGPASAAPATAPDHAHLCTGQS